MWLTKFKRENIDLGGLAGFVARVEGNEITKRDKSRICKKRQGKRCGVCVNCASVKLRIISAVLCWKALAAGLGDGRRFRAAAEELRRHNIGRGAIGSDSKFWLRITSGIAEFEPSDFPFSVPTLDFETWIIRTKIAERRTQQQRSYSRHKFITRNDRTDKCAVLISRKTASTARFHPTISITHKYYSGSNIYFPSLLCFGSINRICRHVSLMHPFWLYWRWHHLLPFPKYRYIPPFPFHAVRQNEFEDIPSNGFIESSGHQLSAIPVKFLKVFKKVPERLCRVRNAFMDFGRWGWDIDSNSVASLLNSFQVEKLESLILDASWKTCSNTSLVRFIAAKFNSIRSLKINGWPCENILYGLSSAALSLISKLPKRVNYSGSFLTHLGLTSFGKNSFSLDALLSLLEASKSTLKQLSLSGGPIANGDLNLSKIGEIVGSTLESFSISFSFTGFTSSSTVIDPNNIDAAAEYQMMGWSPIVHGGLENFSALTRLSISDTGYCAQNLLPVCEVFPFHILRRLIDSIPRYLANSESDNDIMPLELMLHIETYLLSALHVPVLIGSVFKRLDALYLIGQKKGDDVDRMLRRINNLKNSCNNLTILGANYSLKWASEINKNLQDVKLCNSVLKIVKMKIGTPIDSEDGALTVTEN
ncbi:hypothetical protein HK100_012556 [Physocladia obscura]|uniref:Uncharacterized protein n=1 Tax=Physocladia obscura TaxID=109957 RepID=A0AAD5XCE2_9FUNG|nr:hypothetical protein HK100_012556 [Physocladia obscura]